MAWRKPEVGGASVREKTEKAGGWSNVERGRRSDKGNNVRWEMKPYVSFGSRDDEYRC